MTDRASHSRKRLVVVILLAVLWLAATSATAAIFSGKVISVADGDTITVLVYQTRVKVRLYGIDCPEGRQVYGTQAKQATSTLAFGKIVSVEDVDTDRYGRTVGVVTLPDKVNLNQELVKQGMAWWYRHYAPASRQLPLLEEQAREAHIGLWSQSNPVPPWDYRKNGNPATIAPAQPATADAVYVTAHGTAYHRATCRDLTNSKTKHPILRSESVLRGYSHCKTCNP